MRSKGAATLVRNLAVYGLLSVFALISLYPLLWMLLNSLKDTTEIQLTNIFGLPRILRWENYVSAWNRFDVVRYFMNSLFVSAFTVVITLIMAVMFSYGIARMRFRYADAARTYITMGMFIPVQITIIPLLIMMRNVFRLSGTHLSIILPYSAFQLSFAVIVMYGFFRTIPNEIEEAAYIDGAGVFTTFFRIMMPLVKPALASVTIFVFLFAWNEFFMANILLGDNKLYTLPLGLIRFQGSLQVRTDLGALYAAMTIASLPTIMLYLLLSEQVEKALTVGSAVKG
jgi:raffinose/stachyose/melibiose transport system permease protein